MEKRVYKAGYRPNIRYKCLYINDLYWPDPDLLNE